MSEEFLQMRKKSHRVLRRNKCSPKFMNDSIILVTSKLKQWDISYIELADFS